MSKCDCTTSDFKCLERGFGQRLKVKSLVFRESLFQCAVSTAVEKVLSYLQLDMDRFGSISPGTENGIPSFKVLGYGQSCKVAAMKPSQKVNKNVQNVTTL